MFGAEWIRGGDSSHDRSFTRRSLHRLLEDRLIACHKLAWSRRFEKNRSLARRSLDRALEDRLIARQKLDRSLAISSLNRGDSSHDRSLGWRSHDSFNLINLSCHFVWLISMKRRGFYLNIYSSEGSCRMKSFTVGNKHLTRNRIKWINTSLDICWTSLTNTVYYFIYFTFVCLASPPKRPRSHCAPENFFFGNFIVIKHSVRLVKEHGKLNIKHALTRRAKAKVYPNCPDPFSSTSDWSQILIGPSLHNWVCSFYKGNEQFEIVSGETQVETFYLLSNHNLKMGQESEKLSISGNWAMFALTPKR